MSSFEISDIQIDKGDSDCSISVYIAEHSKRVDG